MKLGTKDGIEYQTASGIHVMPYNQEHQKPLSRGLMDATGGHVLFVDGSRKPDLTNFFQGRCRKIQKEFMLWRPFCRQMQI